MIDAIVKLHLHFDVEQSELSTSDYVVALRAIETIVSDLNSRIFEGRLDIELLSVGDQAGSFKGTIRILVKGSKNALAGLLILTAANQALETEFMHGFIEGLTGTKPDYNATGKDIGSFLRDITIQILVTQTDTLETKIPIELNLDKSIKAKSDFFSMCIKNGTIKGVGFSEAHEFPIKRKDFPRHISADKERPLPSQFSLHDAIVVSPVDTDVRQVWRFRDKKTGSSLAGYMEDTEFKALFLNGNYPLKETSADDIMKITIEHKLREKNGVIQAYESCVHTVHTFNGTQLKAINKNLFVSDYRPVHPSDLFN